MADIKRDILHTGLMLWRAGVEPTARRIAAELGLAGHASVLHHFVTSARLSGALAHYAVEQGESRCIVEMIAKKHPAIENMPDAERIEHLRACGR